MNPNPPPASPRRRAKRQASEIVRGEIVALLDLIDRLMELSEEQDSLKDLLNLLEGIGRASTRLVTLLKAERDLTVSQSKDQAPASSLPEYPRPAAQHQLKSANPNGHLQVVNPPNREADITPGPLGHPSCRPGKGAQKESKGGRGRQPHRPDDGQSIPG